MAEFVNMRMEDMIPEFEKMEELRLYDKSEIRVITKKRKDFEGKIQRRTKCKEDYLRYIQHEMGILKEVGIRAKRVGLAGTMNDVEYSVARRVQRLFKEAIQKCKEDVRLWISYFKFCKQMGFQAYVSSSLMQMLSVHGDKPNLWCFAANWEYTESNSVENARQFLLRGLRFHPTSKELYTEAFQLELKYAAKMRKQLEAKNLAEEERRAAAAEGSSGTAKETQTDGGEQRAGTVSDQVLEGRLAEMIFESAIKKINDVKFIIDLSKIAKEFDFTNKLQTTILNHMMSAHANDELTWDTMARRELEGFSLKRALEEENCTGLPLGNIVPPDDDMDNPKQCARERIRKCVSVYDAVVSQLATEKMWSLYIELLLELNQDQSHLVKYKRKLLSRTFGQAHRRSYLQEKYYPLWMDILMAQKRLKKMSVVLKKATERYPANAELWQMRLRLHISADKEKVATTVFREAVAQLGNDKAALPLWKIMILYFQTKDMHKVEQYFQDAVVQGPAISLPLKSMYIEWLVLAKGIVAARKAYDKLSVQPPLCLELHQKMAAMECVQPEINMKHIRRCHEMACEQFGKNNTDVWMEYVKFEQKLGDAKRVSDIYNRAQKNLDPSHVDSFISEFSILKTGMSMIQETPMEF